MGHQDWYLLSSPDGHRAGQGRKLLLGFSAKVKAQVVITRVGSNSVGSEGAHTLRDLRPTVEYRREACCIRWRNDSALKIPLHILGIICSFGPWDLQFSLVILLQ